MLSLSQTTGYAILALASLDSEEGTWVQALEIAERTGIPRPYLSKVLHALGRHGLVRTKRGYRGGFALAAPASKINLLQIVEAIEGTRTSPRCVLGLAGCSDERACPMHEFWTRERTRIEARLRSITLAEMAEFERRVGEVKPANNARRARKAEKKEADHERRR